MHKVYISPKHPNIIVREFAGEITMDDLYSARDRHNELAKNIVGQSVGLSDYSAGDGHPPRQTFSFIQKDVPPDHEVAHVLVVKGSLATSFAKIGLNMASRFRKDARSVHLTDNLSEAYEIALRILSDDGN